MKRDARFNGATVVNRTKETTLAREIQHARSRWQRLVGLMGRASLAEGAGMLFAPIRGVHTHFMRFPIDLVFVAVEAEGTGRVTRVRERMVPFRVDLARDDVLLELPAGTIARTATAVDDRIDFVRGPR
jgi:uncharacterized membrane protein (UPF0127 family)